MTQNRAARVKIEALELGILAEAEERQRARGNGHDTDAEPAWPGEGRIGAYLREPAPPTSYFVDERLLANRGHVATGVGGSSKTRFQYHLAFAAVLGRLPWDWTIRRTGSAALILAEDTAEGVHRTLSAMRSAMQLSKDEITLLEHRLRVFPLAGSETRLLAMVRGELLETSHVGELLAVLDSLPPPVAFVGLDPALALSDGDEMNPAHQRRLGELADRIAIHANACVLMSSHASKGSQMADEVGSHTSRGSGAITDAVRGEIVLRTMTATEARGYGITDIAERKGYVQVTVTKGNELPPSAFSPLWLARGSGGVLYPASLAAQAVDPIGRRELEAFDLLRELCLTVAPPLRDWRDACLKARVIAAPGERAQEKAMQRVKDALLAAGKIERGVGRGVFVPVEAQ